MSRPGSSSAIAWVLGALLATAGAAAVDVVFLDQYTDHLALRAWPCVPGTITKSSVAKKRGPKGIRVWGPDLAYSFTVQGTPRAGDKYQLHDAPSGSNARARRIQAAFPIGAQVTVWHEPKGRQRSVLDRSFTESDIVIWNVAFPLQALALSLWGSAGSRTWWRMTGHPAGGVRVVTAPGSVRAVLCKRAPVSEALGAAAGTGFVLAGVIYFGWIMFDLGRLPGWTPMALAAVGATVGLLVFIWRTALIRAGRFDLIIDEPTGLVALPRTMGRIDDAAVPVDSVTGVTVKEIVRQQGRSKSRVYQPLLHFTDDLGNAASAPLTEWGDRARAEQFAGWLRTWVEQVRLIRAKRRR